MKKKTFGYTLITLLFIICLIELTSFAFFSMFGERFTFFEPAGFTVDGRDIARLSAMYDRKLGWNLTYGTPYEERPRTRDFGRLLITAYGDSYTRCDEVEDDETWEHYLSLKLEADVLNYGIGAYGTDQAYLKFLETYPDVKTPYVILGMTTENINRIVNVFRPFYFPRTGVKLTKPRFVFKNGELDLLKNPVETKHELYRLADPGFVASLGENDRWYNMDRYPRFEFPYSFILFNKNIWREAVYRRSGGIDDVNPIPWANLWEEENSRELMFALMDNFIEKVRREGALPIVAVLPLQSHVARYITGKKIPGVENIEEFCMIKNCLYFNGIKTVAANVETPEELRKLYAGHLSPEGNRMIAEGLYDFIAGREIDFNVPESRAEPEAGTE